MYRPLPRKKAGIMPLGYYQTKQICVTRNAEESQSNREACDVDTYLATVRVA